MIKMNESVHTTEHYEHIKQDIVSQGSRYIEGNPFAIRQYYYEPAKEDTGSKPKQSGCGCQSKMKKTVTTL